MSAVVDYLALACSAVEQADAGTLPVSEALPAAEVFTRFAGSSPDALRVLGIVYLRHRDEALRVGDVGRERMFGSLALARLDQAADAGDELAGEVLNGAKTSTEAVALAKDMLAGSFLADAAAEDAICMAAAAGDEAALNTMLDEAVSSGHDGTRSQRDALYLALTIARVGESFDHASITLRLAGVLILIGQLERQDDEAARGLECETGALIKLSDLLASGHRPAAQSLVAAIDDMPCAAFAAAIHRPALLDLLPQIGECQ